jgi:hypothetical protein
MIRVIVLNDSELLFAAEDIDPLIRSEVLKWIRERIVSLMCLELRAAVDILSYSYVVEVIWEIPDNNLTHNHTISKF